MLHIGEGNPQGQKSARCRQPVTRLFSERKKVIPAKEYQIGTEWCTIQCKDLISHGVPAVHFYTMGKSDNIVRILRECF